MFGRGNYISEEKLLILKLFKKAKCNEIKYNCHKKQRCRVAAQKFSHGQTKFDKKISTKKN